MTLPTLTPEMLKEGAKYGALGLIALYLVYFMTTVVHTELTDIKTTIVHSNTIQEQILVEMRESNDLHRSKFSIVSPIRQ